MRISNVFTAALNVFVLFFVLLSSCFCFAVAFLPHFQRLIIKTALHHTNTFLVLGYALFALALLLFFCFRAIYGRHYLSIKAGNGAYKVNFVIVEVYVQKFLQGAFPNLEIVTESICRHGSGIEIAVRVPEMPRKEIKSFLNSAQKGITKLLSDQFNYKRGFVLTLLFR